MARAATAGSTFFRIDSLIRSAAKPEQRPAADVLAAQNLSEDSIALIACGFRAKRGWVVDVLLMPAVLQRVQQVGQAALALPIFLTRSIIDK
jgi:hypothetical protein